MVAQATIALSLNAIPREFLNMDTRLFKRKLLTVVGLGGVPIIRVDDNE
jgi:hypothetical protein